mmetsp:Transcript_8479/g.24366  ORF Transcript_8479/g.24366 Transcript_8479/m.24366 type:complete len:307 (-) Transcript_8479:105-1025(-)
MIWLHFPKCGSAFEVALVHHACGTRILENYTLLDPLDKMPFKPKKEPCRYSGRKVKFSWANASTCRWNSICGGQMFSRFAGGHDPLWLHPSVPAKWSYRVKSSDLGEYWDHPMVGMPFGLLRSVSEDDLSKVVTLFREPRQRIISHWYHLKSKGLEYSMNHIATWFGACMTQMILGSSCGRTNEDGTPFLFELDPDTVKRGVRERVPRFGFVGLTEHWELTVCLFHAMFGGDCLPSEFLQLRKGISRKSASYDTKEFGLDNYEAIDSEAYSVAGRVFQANLAKFGVSRERCQREVCPRAADRFADL